MNCSVEVSPKYKIFSCTVSAFANGVSTNLLLDYGDSNSQGITLTDSSTIVSKYYSEIGLFNITVLSGQYSNYFLLNG